MAMFVLQVSWGQMRSAAPISAANITVQPGDHSAEALYLQLRSVGLDKSRVYKIRGASLDRAALHISFEDGIIAFTEDVAGHVTGALFEGEGEVLLVPIDQAERASMMLFTGAAILEERFSTAYFRFNDGTFAELQPLLRAADQPQEFVSHWNQTAHNLAETDALRLLLSFSKFLPTSDREKKTAEKSGMAAEDDRMLHARVQGSRLGTFDLYFDSLAPEQIWAGQLKTVEGQSFYDVWTSFSLGQPPEAADDTNGVLGEAAKPEAVGISLYRILSQVAPPT